MRLVVVVGFAWLAAGALKVGIRAARTDGFRAGLGLIVGGASYLAAAYFGYTLHAWWPLIAGFGAAWLARLWLGEPGWNR